MKYAQSLILFEIAKSLNFKACHLRLAEVYSIDKPERFIYNLLIKEAIKIKPNLVDIFYNQGNCLIKLKRFEEAIKSYNELLKSKPNYYKAIFNKAFCLEHSHNGAELATFEQSRGPSLSSVTWKPFKAIDK